MNIVKSALGILLLTSLLTAPAAFARDCRYALLGDFIASVGPTNNVTRLNLDSAADPKGCPGKQYCDGQMMCKEDDGKYTFKEVHCLAQGDGRCPQPIDCDADQQKSGLGTLAAYDGKGVPKNLSIAESDPTKVGTQCGRTNNDLGKDKCSTFCAGRCTKFLAATPDKIASCISMVADNCRPPVVDDGGDSIQNQGGAGGR